MKNWILLFALLLCGLSQAQIKLNKETGLFERKVRISKNRQILINKLTSNGLDVDETLASKGSFVHMVNDVSPVVIYYVGQEREGKYIFTAFKLEPEANVGLISLEALPVKQRKLWIPIINEKLASLRL